ncbi:pyridoxal phosphate biosynthetic protein [Erythrobacter sp. YT30]|uniref:pyridoxal phosphate biosynthetic protein n=1 Tax=Erythrobacter sp. YT30 TaxID=1735012 RepID=UPI00076D7E07|nr:pyridoxal phosphate biosynthetic protein [Erythrobacter sp. YT30]KWV90563.1 pyridoxal phosphate biosynthetic protein [Erythrobacter sp. YT30]
MNGEPLPELSRSQKLAAGAAAALFLIAVGFLGFALANQVLVPFAIGWVALQIFGYVGALKFAKGDFAHPLFMNQVLLHVIALALLSMALMKALS